MVLIRHHLPGITNAEITAILLGESGIRENDTSKSLSNPLQRCSIFEDKVRGGSAPIGDDECTATEGDRRMTVASGGPVAASEAGAATTVSESRSGGGLRRCSSVAASLIASAAKDFSQQTERDPMALLKASLNL